MKIIIVSVLVSAVVSVSLTKIITAHHFKVIDSYVRDMIDLAKEQIKEAYSSRDKR